MTAGGLFRQAQPTEPPRHTAMSSGDETGSLLGSSKPLNNPSIFARYSVGDWLITMLLFALGLWADSWTPVQRVIGPQLHDPTIQYPHTTNSQQMVPAYLLWRLSVGVPLFLLLLLALCLTPRGVSAARLLSELWLGCLSSVASAFLFICIVKVQVGRLRPDFIARCVPDKVTGLCTGDPAVVMEGRKSFPSGHSTLVFSGLGFASLALGAALADLDTPRLGQLWKGPVALTPWMVALAVALSRLSDYWHHWQDVLVGSLIGHLAAYFAYRLRFPSPLGAAGGARLVPHVALGEAEPKSHLSPPPSSVGV